METKVNLKTQGNKNTVEYAIRKFLENKNNKCVKVQGMSPSDFLDCLENCGLDVNHDSTDFNGWQCDYSVIATYNGEKFSINGTAWYGTTEINRVED